MIGVNRRSILIGTVAAIAAAVSTKGLRTGGMGSAAHAAVRRPTRHIVEITEFSFVPEVLEARPGDSIVWINRDLVPHTATAHDMSWDTGTITKGVTSDPVMVSTEMPQGYFCRFHPAMKARITGD